MLHWYESKTRYFIMLHNWNIYLLDIRFRSYRPCNMLIKQPSLLESYQSNHGEAAKWSPCLCHSLESGVSFHIHNIAWCSLHTFIYFQPYLYLQACVYHQLHTNFLFYILYLVRYEQSDEDRYSWSETWSLPTHTRPHKFSNHMFHYYSS